MGFFRRADKVGGRGAGYEPVVGRSPSTAQLLPSHEAGGGSRRARSLAASALLEDCDEEDEEDFDEEEVPRAVERAHEPAASSQTTLEQMDVDAQAIYGMKLAEESGPSPRYELPHDLEGDEGDVDDEIGPDDSISVAWFKAHKPAAPARAVPVTIEAPDGSRHAMDVELDGLQSMAELRRGMLQGYRELLGEQLPAHALRVHARLASGSSVLLLDATPLTPNIMSAVSFYVWAAKEAADPEPEAAGEDLVGTHSTGVPSIAQRKDRLAQSGARLN